jgi:hypothetical protein
MIGTVFRILELDGVYALDSCIAEALKEPSQELPALFGTSERKVKIGCKYPRTLEVVSVTMLLDLVQFDVSGQRGGRPGANTRPEPLLPEFRR